jgi:purine-binding chemotaxis protein CheW
LTSAASRRLQLVVFLLDGRRYGLHLDATERVLPMVAIAPLPGCPEVVLGAINLHGDIVPVLDARRRLGLPPSDYGPAARLLIARTPRRTVALPVDDVLGVAEVGSERVAAPDAVVPGIAHVAGVAALADGLLLVHDLDTFFSLEEERRLDDALGHAGV